MYLSIIIMLPTKGKSVSGVWMSGLIDVKGQTNKRTVHIHVDH